MEKGKVFISPNPVKTTERLDFNGNVIDPITKQVIVPKEADVVIPPANIAPATPQNATESPVTSPTPKDDGLSVLDEIEATKRRLAELEEAKKSKIEEMENQLKALKQ